MFCVYEGGRDRKRSVHMHIHIYWVTGTKCGQDWFLLIGKSGGGLGIVRTVLGWHLVSINSFFYLCRILQLLSREVVWTGRELYVV